MKQRKNKRKNFLIINELRRLNSEMAKLARINFELIAMYGRINRVIETLYQLGAEQMPKNRKLGQGRGKPERPAVSPSPSERSGLSSSKRWKKQ